MDTLCESRGIWTFTEAEGKNQKRGRETKREIGASVKSVMGYLYTIHASSRFPYNVHNALFSKSEIRVLVTQPHHTPQGFILAIVCSVRRGVGYLPWLLRGLYFFIFSRGGSGFEREREERERDSSCGCLWGFEGEK